MFLCRRITNKHRKPTKPSGLPDGKQAPSPPPTEVALRTSTTTPQMVSPSVTAQEALIQQLPLNNQALARLLLQQQQPSQQAQTSLDQNTLLALASLL